MDEVKQEADLKQAHREKMLNDQKQYANILQKQKQERINQGVRAKEQDKVLVEAETRKLAQDDQARAQYFQHLKEF